MKLTYLSFLLLFCAKLSFAGSPEGSTPDDSLYVATFNELVAMLEGKIPIDFKKAVFFVENAFLNGQLNEDEYNISIAALAGISTKIAEQENLVYSFRDSSNIRLNWGITRLFMDSFKLNLNGQSLDWFPPQYNFNDPLGQKDWTSTFVTKLLVTGEGNCRSMPYLYKMIANEIGAKVSLVLAPSHIYLRTTSANHKVGDYNIELTSKVHPIDGWIITTSYIGRQAIKNNLYMKDLSDKEALVLVLLDLAQGYEKKFPEADKGFIKKCVKTALKYFPNCVNAHLLDIEFLANQYRLTQIPTFLDEMAKTCTQLLELGYDEMPKEMYADGLAADERYQRDQKNYTETVNQKHIPYGFGAATSLTKGKYLEAHTEDNLERIGSVIFNRKTGKVESVEVLQKVGDLTMSPAVVGRFLSVDPLTASYPMLTPYQFASNRPIDGVDLDGLEFKKAEVFDEKTGKTYIKITAAVNLDINAVQDPIIANSYKAEAQKQFNLVLQTASTENRVYSGELIFDGNASIQGSIAPRNPDDLIAGISFPGSFSASSGYLQGDGSTAYKNSLSVALDFVHELLHQIGIEHPTNEYSPDDAKLIRLPGPLNKEFRTTDKTDSKIFYNVMLYGSHVVDGKKVNSIFGRFIEENGNRITKGQAKVMETYINEGKVNGEAVFGPNTDDLEWEGTIEPSKD